MYSVVFDISAYRHPLIDFGGADIAMAAVFLMEELFY